MTQADLDKILDACQPVPLIMLQCGMPRSQQERANDAWKELGGRLGFDFMTVEPTREGDRIFTAIPTETNDQRLERERQEESAKRAAEITQLGQVIVDAQARIKELSRTGFTLIELMAVLAIVSVLFTLSTVAVCKIMRHRIPNHVRGVYTQRDNQIFYLSLDESGSYEENKVLNRYQADALK